MLSVHAQSASWRPGTGSNTTMGVKEFGREGIGTIVEPRLKLAHGIQDPACLFGCLVGAQVGVRLAVQ
jgi:hypothetical protein